VHLRCFAEVTDTPHIRSTRTKTSHTSLRSTASTSTKTPGIIAKDVAPTGWHAHTVSLKTPFH